MKKSKVFIFIIAFVLFMLLTVYIGAYIYSIYTTTKSFSLSETQKTLECGEFAFSVKVLQIDGTKETLSLKNKGTEITQLIVRINNTDQTISFANFIKGSTKKIELEKIGEVYIFVPGCETSGVEVS